MTIFLFRPFANRAILFTKFASSSLHNIQNSQITAQSSTKGVTYLLKPLVITATSSNLKLSIDKDSFATRRFKITSLPYLLGISTSKPISLVNFTDSQIIGTKLQSKTSIFKNNYSKE